jgi:hypothetical protein
VLLLERCRHIPIVVMIAEDGEDPIWRTERREKLRNGADVLAVAEGHVISAEDDQIRLLRHRELHRVGNIGGRHHEAVMNVGEERDA